MIRHTATKCRPSADIPWHDPDLTEAWLIANQDRVDVNLLRVSVSLSEDQLSETIICEYQDVDSCILSQKELVSDELRAAQKNYRQNAGIYLLSETWEDTETGKKYTEDELFARETEMRAAGMLTEHRYMRV